jgi:hypothetical protein
VSSVEDRQMKSVFSVEHSLGHPHIGLMYQFIVGENTVYSLSKVGGDDMKG